MAIKEEIIEILEKNRGRSVSGQELADALGVTRAAVWKAIRALTSEGYRLKASTNRGYMLEPDSFVISRAGIRAFAAHDLDVRVYREVDTTNRVAKLAAADGAPSGTVIVAETQTAGRGRRGRSFFTRAGGGVYFSVILRPKVDAARSVLVTTAAALAAAEAIEELTGKQALIKWINDVCIDEKKCVGILTEATFDYESGNVDSVVVGIGINTGREQFPEELKGIACSIGEVNCNALIACVADKLMDLADKLPDNSHLEAYRRRCFVLGRRVTVIAADGQTYEAFARDMDDLGRLIVVTDAGEERALSNEEVSVRLKEATR